MIALAGLFGLAAMVGLVLRAATVALPLFLAVTIGRLCLQAGTGPLAAAALGGMAGVVAHGLAQGLFASAGSPTVRSVLALVFVAPAAVAGWQVASALAALSGADGVVRGLAGGVGACLVGFAALRRLGAPLVPVACNESFG